MQRWIITSAAAPAAVSFVVEGGRVTHVQALTGPADYRRRVAAGGAQAFTMTVRFA